MALASVALVPMVTYPNDSEVGLSEIRGIGIEPVPTPVTDRHLDDRLDRVVGARNTTATPVFGVAVRSTPPQAPRPVAQTCLYSASTTSSFLPPASPPGGGCCGPPCTSPAAAPPAVL